jgi:hypothetical protein
VREHDLTQRCREPASVRPREGRARRERQADRFGRARRGALEALDAPRRIDRHQAPADGDRTRLPNLAGLDQGQFRRPATDVDVQDRLTSGRGIGDRAGALRRQHGFQMMAGRGAHEFAAFSRKEVGDGPGVGPLEGHAGQDDGAGVDVLGSQCRRGVRRFDEPPQRRPVDEPIWLKRREDDRRAVHDLALRDDIPRRQCGRVPL